MAERLRAWLAGGHECDLDLGEGSAQELWRRSRTPAIAVGLRRTTGALVYARARSSGLRSKVGLIHRTTLSSGEAHKRGAHMPESGLPIRVYKEHDLWHVDYGEGETEDHTSREEAEAAADAVAQAEERTVVVEE